MEALRSAFCGTTEVLREAIIDKLVALGIGAEDLPGLAKDEGTQKIIIKSLCPSSSTTPSLVANATAQPAGGSAVTGTPSTTTSGEGGESPSSTVSAAESRAVLALKIRTALASAAETYSSSIRRQSMVADTNRFMEMAKKKHGHMFAELMPNPTLLKLLFEDLAGFRDLRINADAAPALDGQGKPALGADGGIIWVNAQINTGTKPKNLAQLLTVLVPYIAALEVVSGCSNQGPVGYMYILHIVRLAAAYGEDIALKFDTQFRQKLRNQALMTSAKSGIPFTEAVLKHLSSCDDYELLVKAYASGVNVEAPRSEATKPDVVRPAGAKPGKSRDDYQKQKSDKFCPYSRSECPYLKVRKCHFAPWKHKGPREVGSKEEASAKKARTG